MSSGFGGRITALLLQDGEHRIRSTSLMAADADEFPATIGRNAISAQLIAR
jgi:hypothetical protein